MPEASREIGERPAHLILVIIWDFVAAFLWSIGLAAAALFAYPFSPGYQGTTLEVGDVFGMVVGTLLLLMCFAVSLAAGIGLLKGRRWGRIVSMVAAVASLFIVPIGTVVGALVLAHLLKSDGRDRTAGSL